MNKFEQAAKDYQRVPRPSWSHTEETYQGNRKGRDWFFIGATGFLLLFGIVLLIALL